jgi:peroxiredoxin
VVGISTDSAQRQRDFAASVNTPNPFVSDPDGQIIESYGAGSEGRAASRFYFLIDEDGTILWKDVTGRLIPVDALLTQLREVVGGD